MVSTLQPTVTYIVEHGKRGNKKIVVSTCGRTDAYTRVTTLRVRETAKGKFSCIGSSIIPQLIV